MNIHSDFRETLPHPKDSEHLVALSEEHVRRTMDRKEAILDAALELFSERGFHGTTVAMIAQRANVGAGTIYRYFADKDDLVNALFQQWKQAMMDALIRGLPTDLSPRRLFHELWRRFAKFSRDNPLVLTFLEFHYHASYLSEASRELCDGFHDHFLELFDELRQKQITKDAPPQLVFALVIGAFTVVEKAFQSGELERSPESEALAEELCWEAIRR